MTVKKAVILAGGFGTRLSEETVIKPKPLVEIGSRPILWHIMKLYDHAGIKEFIICLGYKGYLIKEYFSNYFLHQSDVTFDFSSNAIEYHNKRSEDWKVTLVDTGPDTMTGGRIKKIRDYVGSEPFCLTYGDGVSDVKISELIKFHSNRGKIATVTAVSPPGRFSPASPSSSALDCVFSTSKNSRPMVDLFASTSARIARHIAFRAALTSSGRKRNHINWIPIFRINISHRKSTRRNGLCCLC